MDILVVEESEVTRMIIRRELSDEFGLVPCKSTEEAREAIDEQNPFDLVLLANTLPSGDSYEFCKEIRKHEDTQDLPVIIMGTSNRESYYQEAFEAGANAFLEKPFGKEDLTELLMHLSSRTEFSRSKNILVTDDSPSVRKVLRNSLEEVGFSVREAENGRDGLEEIRSKQPDLLSVDLEMPEMDGFTMVREIEDDPEYAEIPTIMLTSREGEETREKARDVGVDAFLTKPFQSDQYLKTVARLLNSNTNFEQYEIWYVDDSKTARLQLEECLQNEGYQSRSFEAGTALLDEVDERINSDGRLPDMILADLLMPGLDGLTVLRNLRNREELDETPILIVSSHDKPDVIVKAINAGANDFISKPYAVEDVLDRLRIHLQEKTGQAVS